MSAVKFDCFFELDNAEHPKGQRSKLKKRFNTENPQRFLTESITNLWNSLDDEIVWSVTLRSFINGLHQL